MASYGYQEYADSGVKLPYTGLWVAAFSALLLVLPGYGLWHSYKGKERIRIKELTEYIGELNLGSYRLRPSHKEDRFSGLEDEVYKTVVLLREGREQMAKQKQSLSDNLADIAHQLKTPLSSITLLCDLLMDQFDNHNIQQSTTVSAGEGIQYAQAIADQAERMTILLSGLLTLSRIDAGSLELEHKPIDVEELLWSAGEVVRPLVSQNQQTLTYHVTPCHITGDFHWLTEALINLLKNCAEHTQPGGEISIACETNPIYTKIIIEDNGSGAAIEDLPHLFNRFYRGKNAAKDSIGIGLALTKSIIERSNGEIKAQNRQSGGMRFTIKLMKSVTELSS